jgi:hypothetical protein
MAKKKYQAVGRVVDRSSRQGVPDARVEAWDKDLLFDDLLGSAVTGADGSFKINFETSSFFDLFLEQKPDLFFKVYYGGRLVGSTEDSVLWNIEAGKTEKTIEVDIADGPKSDAGSSKGEHKMPKGKTGDTPKSTSPKSTPPKSAAYKQGGKKDGKGDKGGKKNGKDKKGPSPYLGDFVTLTVSRKCAIEFLTQLSVALGSPSPKKKKKKGKKDDKGKKGKGYKGDKGDKGYKGDKGDKGGKGGKDGGGKDGGKKDDKGGKGGKKDVKKKK